MQTSFQENEFGQMHFFFLPEKDFISGNTDKAQQRETQS
jgi:hypothetical protein